MDTYITAHSVRYYRAGTYHMPSTHKTMVSFQGEGSSLKAQEFLDVLLARTDEAQTADRYYLVAECRVKW